MTDKIRISAQSLIDVADQEGYCGPESVGREVENLRAALATYPDCGKPTPPDSTHTCLPQQPDDWEGIAADQALTIAMLQLDKQCLLEGLQYAVKQVPSLGDVPGIRSQLAAVPDSDAVNATLETMQQEQKK